MNWLREIGLFQSYIRRDEGGDQDGPYVSFDIMITQADACFVCAVIFVVLVTGLSA